MGSDTKTSDPIVGLGPWQNLKSFVLYSIWIVLQYTYEYTSLFYEGVTGVWKGFKSFFSSPDEKKQFIELNKRVKTFPKVPRHLAISVVINEKEIVDHQDKVKLVQSVAQTVSYAYAANIRTISLYDSKGILKTLQSKLNRSIQKEVTRIKLILKSKTENETSEKATVVKELPLVKFHSVNGNSNEVSKDMETNDDEDILNMFIFSREDGKPVILEAIKDIYKEHYQDKNEKESIKPKITEKMLDSYINRYVFGHVLDKLKVSSEPDLLMVFGRIKSTLGFLPWHVRLTEIHWMPSIHKADIGDFLGSLIKFAKCEQRFGK